MKKIVLLVIVVLVLFGCASVPTEFDPTVTPFEGEWNGFNSKNGIIFTYIFTGNRWEYTRKNINNDKNDVYLTGLFSYKHKKVMYSNEKGKGTKGTIQFSNENGKFTLGYELRGTNRLVLQVLTKKDEIGGSYGRIQTVYGAFTKQPYGDFTISYVTKEKKFSDIVSNREELTKIQGTWRHYNKRATYTFSGDLFILKEGVKSPVTGTVKIKDNILYLIVSDEKYGIFSLDFLPNNRIFLIGFWVNSDLWWGEFIKQ